MSARSLPVLLVVLVICTSACNGPLPFLSGGKLGGMDNPTPQSWSIVGDFGFVQLETNPQDPYSVNIAYTVMNEILYVNAGDSETQWVKNMNANPNVRLRMDDVIYRLKAERVTRKDEIAAFGEAWTSKSVFHRDPTELDEVWIYRLVTR